MDLEEIGERLRKLPTRQEKVVRMYFGLGCQRCHSAQEMAEEFGVSEQVIAGLLGAAQRGLAREGLAVSDLQQAARREAEFRHSTGIAAHSTRTRHSHRLR